MSVFILPGLEANDGRGLRKHRRCYYEIDSKNYYDNPRRYIIKNKHLNRNHLL